MPDEKQLTQDISSNELGSQHSGELRTTDQDGSTMSIPLGRPVMMSRKQLKRMMAHQTDHGRVGAQRASEPLVNGAHEALARFLATPEPMREFKSITALAKYYEVSRMTVHRWRHYAVVLQRAEWLSQSNRLPGVLVARTNWERVVQAQVAKALTGDTQAARFLRELAWAEDTPTDQTPVEVELRVVYEKSPKLRENPKDISRAADTLSESDPAPR